MINAICGVCDSFLDTHDDGCYELNTWGELIRVNQINNLNADDSIYCSKSCHKKECKQIEEVA